MRGGVIERLAREKETDPHSKPVTKRKDEKLCFPVKFDVGKNKKRTPLYRPTVVWITGVFAGINPPPHSSWLAAVLGGSQHQETAAEMERVHVFVHGAAAALHARWRCQNAAFVVSMFFQDK